MEGHSLKDRVILHQLQTVGSVLLVLHGVVSRSAGHAAGLVLSAFENDFHACIFLFL